MYREKIRDYYDHLSRSYRRVADFVLSNYYEVSFMTAAQLAFAVGVDTTTVVRFSQRLGYNGYPELLHDIRDQVKAEVYAYYVPPPLDPADPAAVFKSCAEQEQNNLSRMLIHNPPAHVEQVARVLVRAREIVLVAEGYAVPVAEMTAQQLRHRGFVAQAAGNDAARLAGTLAALTSDTLVIGVSATTYGKDVARALLFARSRGCTTLGIVGSLASPVNRMCDLVVFAPTDAAGPLPSVVGLTAALAALVLLASHDSQESADRHAESFAQAYEFLVGPDTDLPDDESAGS